MSSAPMNDVLDTGDALDRGVFDARYLAFLATVQDLRPSLHRYCARMTGSVADGEDVVQEALFHAYRRLDTFDDARPMKPWLFRIAHNRCIDLLRQRGVREEAEAGADVEQAAWPADPPGPALGRAIEHLVVALPPLERACVLLKDVLDHSLDEIAELTGSTVGGVKAALHRGRTKLAAPPSTPRSRAPVAISARDRSVLEEYVARFNRRDWEGLRELVRADARVRVADRFTGSLADSGYFARYAAMAPVRLALAEVDGAPMLVAEHEERGVWVPHGIVRVRVATDGGIAEIADYKACPWVLDAAGEVRAL